MSSISEIEAKEKEAKRKKETRQAMERTIEEAKWNMYAEKWDLAEKQLQEARDEAVSLRDKSKIDEILELLVKCKNEQKVEL
jgi:vacuolar-type H+-ATPase subunit H